MSSGKKIRFVVIGGCERSGTTLASRLLGGHPDIHYVPTDMVVFDRYDILRKWTGIQEPNSPEKLQRACQEVLTHPTVAKWGLSRDDVSRVSRNLPGTWDGLFLTLAYALAEKYPSKVICFKHPTSEAHFPRVHKLFEEQGDGVRFLYCVRCPFDVYLSWKHRASAWTGGQRLDPRPIRWCSDWISSTTEALNSSYALGDLMRIIRYEDLVSDPFAYSAELSAFIGVDSTQSAEMVASLDSVAANTSFQLSGSGRLTGVLNTLERKGVELNDFEKNVIRAACGKRAATFGFELGRPDKSVLGVRAIEYEVMLESLPTSRLLSSILRLLLRRTVERFRPDPIELPRHASSRQSSQLSPPIR